ncbi:MAG: hypothetical protein R6W73_01930 [Candidatus Saliniplasma sp.]
MKIKLITLSVVIALCLTVIPISDLASAQDEVYESVWVQSPDSVDMEGYNLDLQQDIDDDSHYIGTWYRIDYYLENAISLDVDVYDTNYINDNGQDYTEIKVRVTADAYAEGVVTPGENNYNGYGIDLQGEFTSEDSEADAGELDILTSQNHGTNTIGDNWYGQGESDEPGDTVKAFVEEAAWTFADEVSPVPMSWATLVYEDIDATKTNLKGDATSFGEEAFIEFQNEIEEGVTDSTYQAQTVFQFKVPNEGGGKYTLHLSAQNLIGEWRQVTDEIRNIYDGAEATVSIPIKNSKIESVESENKGTNTHLSTEKYVHHPIVLSPNC